VESRIGSWEWDVLRDVVAWSDEMYRIYGLEPGSSVDYTRFLDFVHPDDRTLVDESVQRAFATGSEFAFRHRIIRTDGQELLLDAKGEAVTDAGGAVIRMLGTGRVVT
jgi:PAS domain-containing protein